jgi:hypothetical protein
VWIDENIDDVLIYQNRKAIFGKSSAVEWNKLISHENRGFYVSMVSAPGMSYFSVYSTFSNMIM